MRQMFEQDGVDIRQAAGEAHWQIGKCERHGQWFNIMLTKVLQQIQPVDEEEWRLCVDSVLDQKNRLLRKHGFSPYQHALGRDPPLPADLLVDRPDEVSNSAALHDVDCERATSIRLAARMNILAFNDDVALRKALDARPRLQRLPTRDQSIQCRRFAFQASSGLLSHG